MCGFGSSDRDGPAASTSEARKRTHYIRTGQLFFDKRSHKLVTLAVGSYGRLGKEGSQLIDQLIGGMDGRSLSRNGICNEIIFQLVLFQIVSVTTQVAIPRQTDATIEALRHTIFWLKCF